MKNFEEMKKDNKGFSLVELIVVIAIMAVLIAVLGSTILGYVEKSKYSKDVQALDSIKTAVSTCVAEVDTVYTDGTKYTLNGLISQSTTNENVINGVLAEVFNGNDFNNASQAFKDVTKDNVFIMISNGAVYIEVKSTDSDFKDYTAGTKPKDFDTTTATGGTGTGATS